MRKRIRFHILLPAAETVLAGLFAGIGLWQRNQILSRPFFGDQTLWETTARFHVFPWPYKFAAISNMPAFLAGALVSLPIHALWPELPETIELALYLVFVALLWYWVGHRLDRRWSGVGTDSIMARTKTSWAFLSVFTAVCLTGAFLPLGYAGYLPYGVVVWIATAATIHLTKKPPVTQIPPPLV